MIKVLALLLCLLFASCNLSDPTPNLDLGTTEDTGGQEDTTEDTTAVDVAPDSSVDACTPNACEADQCGMIDDGCGGMVDCGMCGCVMASDCPSQPCQTAACETNECIYSAVSCGGVECAECADGECDTDEELRRCGGTNSCPVDACDPSPMTDAQGTITFANVCIDEAPLQCDHPNLCVVGQCDGVSCNPAPCGPCGLGFWDCNAANEATCFGIPLTANIDEATLNCNDRSVDSSFVYLDGTIGVDDVGSGTKDVPFLTLEAALDAAEARGAIAVIIGGAFDTSDTYKPRNGIALYGGFTDAPEFVRDPTIRPTIVGSALGNAVAIDAENISEPTLIFGITAKSNSTLPSSSSYGLRAQTSPGLVIVNVDIEAGSGKTGRPGSVGTRGRNGGRGGSTTGFLPGDRGINPNCMTAAGGIGGQGNFGNASTPGLPSASGVPGGAIGQSGSTGQLGMAGQPGLSGKALPSVENGEYVKSEGSGTPGGSGTFGQGGGGGGAGLGSVIIRGGGGGGGGAGGCGGTGGTGGNVGGNSIGALLIDSTGIRFAGGTILTNNGGNGGPGAIGGDGGTGGGFGAGGNGQNPGALGGLGRNGGPGGQGGGGAGGDSIGVMCSNTNPDVANPPTITLGTPGNGGVGGSGDAPDGVAVDVSPTCSP